jgi:hypothetical protein
MGRLLVRRCYQIRPGPDQRHSQQDGSSDSDQKAHIDQCRAAHSDHIVLDQRRHRIFVHCCAEGHGDDHRCEHADAIGGKILQTPRHGGKDRGAQLLGNS